ncbi:MAG: hypothetical protein Q4G36_13055 [Paracoccus sp. (in: a-proteobacteria)]|nr:hypothetical protein [Paracoccus sp. (in: a-proteobacteria)]
MNIEKLISQAADSVMSGDYETAFSRVEKAEIFIQQQDVERVQHVASIERLGELARAAQTGLDDARRSIRQIVSDAGDVRLYDTSGNETNSNVSRRRNIKL